MKFIQALILILASASAFAQHGAGSNEGGDKCHLKVQQSAVKDVLHSAEVVIKKLTPKVIAEDKLDFDMNLEHLQKGGSQYSTEFDDVKSFVKDNPTMKTIDFKGLFENKSSHVWASKAAYVMDVDPQWFTDERLNDADYQGKTMPDDFRVSAVKGQPNQLQYNKKGSSFLGLYKVPDVESVSEGISFDLVHNKGDMDPAHLQGILKMNPEIKARPEKVTVSFNVRTSDERSKGTISVSKYYRIDKTKTLLVNYCFAVVDKPSLVPGWAIRKAIKAFAPEESGKLVKKMRTHSGEKSKGAEELGDEHSSTHSSVSGHRTEEELIEGMDLDLDLSSI